MITRLVRRQLAIFTILATVALLFTAFKYANAPAAVGLGRYELSAQFKDTSGLYPRAIVTYRGVDVGKVSALDLNEDGVLVRMSIDSSVRVPKDVSVRINSTSAIGEQYVDLVPNGHGPSLVSGAIVPESQTVEMPQISPVLESLNSLLESVPKAKTTAVLDEVDAALGGSSQDLGDVIDQTSRVVDEAQQEIASTTALISNLSPLLDTQADLGDQTRSYVTALSSFTEQLEASDPDLRRILSNAPGAVGETDELIDSLRPKLPTLLRDASTTADVLNVYTPNVRQLFIQYPALQSRIQSMLLRHADEGAVKLDLRTSINNPPSCLDGYIPVSERRDPSDTSLTDTPAVLHCEQASDAPSGVRGARNALCPNDPSRRAATPAGCGLFFGGSNHAEGRTASGSGDAPPVGMLDMLGGTSSDPGGESWKMLLTDPLGL
jgi:phospholipid/cholesterol/gamma-HCH transport system substrate-binding protein